MGRAAYGTVGIDLMGWPLTWGWQTEMQIKSSSKHPHFRPRNILYMAGMAFGFQFKSNRMKRI
jgi:hypothetical protein